MEDNTLWTVSANAGDPIIIKPDPIHPNRYQFTDQAGNRVGAVVQSFFRPFHPSATPQEIHGKDGQRIGTIKPDPINPDRYRIFDRQGNPAGSLKPDPLYPVR